MSILKLFEYTRFFTVVQSTMQNPASQFQFYRINICRFNTTNTFGTDGCTDTTVMYNLK